MLPLALVQLFPALPLALLHCCFPDPIQPTVCWTDLQSHALPHREFLPSFFPFCRFISFSFFHSLPMMSRNYQTMKITGGHTCPNLPVSRWNLLSTVQNDSRKDLLSLLQYWSATCQCRWNLCRIRLCVLSKTAKMWYFKSLQLQQDSHRNRENHTLETNSLWWVKSLLESLGTSRCLCILIKTKHISSFTAFRNL